MLLIGLTGSIATGKSTVASLLASPPHSLPVIDADVLARRVVEPGTSGYHAIVRHFGPSTPDLLVEASESMPARGPDGKGRPINRPALGRRVFGDSEDRVRERCVLNGIVHPAVRRYMFRAIVGFYLRGYSAVVVDVPLLYESRLHRFCGVTIVVAAQAETQMQRLMARDTHLTREDAEHRVRSQGDVRVKAARCAAAGGLVLWNDASKQELAKNLYEGMNVLLRASPHWWSSLLLAFPPLALLLAVRSMLQNVATDRRWEAVKEKL
ncbi:Dephospho-CoA kinase [Ophiocordyceps camponoti-floridani]|uniref:Dephospho-CoA kinase n=1 Tax=Ophiocordyceps camponoti-floridani TaxID=2030778 RepID=A0A8H4Q8P6_9HYPO|nr:Dephospho-CoA kinase [Ophiocordyceps camponoti-floridani]